MTNAPDAHAPGQEQQAEQAAAAEEVWRCPECDTRVGVADGACEPHPPAGKDGGVCGGGGKPAVLTVRLPLVSVHRGGDAAADALTAEVRRRLDLEPGDGLLSAVVMSLHWDHRAAISDLLADMWFGVAAHGAAHDGFPETRLWVECDLAELGVAAAWKYFADRADTAAAQERPGV